MLRSFALILVCAALARGQFTSLATTDTGDEVFFVTTHRQTGTSQTAHPKVFARDDDGLHLLYDPESLGPPFGPFRPSAASVSGDGSLVAFDVAIPCFGGSSCFLRELSSGTLIDRNTGAETHPGPHVRISRNGRFLLTWSSSNALGGKPPAIIDRTTGQTPIVQDIRSVGDGRVASDGSALLASGLQLVHVSPAGGIRTLATLTGFGILAIQLSDSGRAAVYETPDHRLFVVDVDTTTAVQLGPDDRDSYGATLSSDGQWVLYVSAIDQTPQLFFSRTDGSLWRQLTTTPEGVAEAVLSGDGRLAWVSTQGGRLLRIDTSTGETIEILAPPVLEDVTGPVVPGSLIHLRGRRLDDRVEVNGHRAPIFIGDAGDVYAQVPWDLPPFEEPAADVSVSVAREGSPLEAVTPDYSLNYGTFFPAAFLEPVHEDWSGFVTAESPARPGEVIHIYATGLGPVDCPIETGATAPLDRPCRPTTAIDWDYWWTSTDSLPADVRLAGLAPGLAGLYQIDAVVPSHPPAERLKLIANRFGFFVVADFTVQ